MHEIARSIFLIINKKTLIITFLSVTATFICHTFNLQADLPITFVMSAVVFPIVFSINAAYVRRETALDRYGSLKASGQAVYFLTRDWTLAGNKSWVTEVRECLGEIILKTQDLLMDESQSLRMREVAVYENFSRLSALIAKGSSKYELRANEVSLCNSHLKEMLFSFETLKHIFQYRTPTTLRTFSRIFIVSLPILYSPYFAFISADYGGALTIMMPTLFTITLSSLDNIQMHLENPFDQVGEDDISINADKFLLRLEP